MLSATSRTISQAQYDQLSNDIVSANRVAFYVHLFQYSGSETALTMSQISSSSSITGGIAWGINAQIQKLFQA